MKNNRLAFSAAGSLLLIAMFVTINLLTSPGFIWSVFPSFSVLWWPLSIFSYEKKSAILFAILGFVMSAVFFITVNIMTSPGFPWSMFPIFAILWWPIGIFCYRRKSALLTSIIITSIVSFFFIAVNLITSAGFLWSIFPIICMLWWPISVYCSIKKNYKLFSLLGSLLIATLFLTIDLSTTTGLTWSYYVLLPLFVWPACMYLKKSIKIITILIISGLILIAGYVSFNLFLSPGYPWSVFVSYGISWAMVSSYFWYKKKPIVAIISTIIISVIFVPAIMYLTNINDIWLIEAAFSAVSIQSAIFLVIKKRFIALERFGSISLAIILVYNYFTNTTDFPWILMPAFPIVWLFVMSLFKNQSKTFWFALFSTFTGIIYYMVLNYILSPDSLWFIYPTFALAWWPLAIFCSKNKRKLLFSIIGSSLIIILLGTINLVTSPSILWSVFPSFVLLWWPLSVYFVTKKRKVVEEHKQKS